MYRNELGEPRESVQLLVLLTLVVAICGLCGFGLWGFNRVSGTVDGPGGEVKCSALSWDGECTVTFDRQIGGATVQLNGRRVQLLSVSGNGDAAEFEVASIFRWSSSTVRIRVGEDHEFSNNIIELFEITEDKVVVKYWPPS